MTSLRLRMLEDMQIRNLAVNTQESYVQQISLFARLLQSVTGAVGAGADSYLSGLPYEGKGAGYRFDPYCDFRTSLPV
jgi:hypothetical protein